jgi:hypothetical protein
MLNVMIRTETKESYNVYKHNIWTAVDSARERPIQRNRSTRVAIYSQGCEVVLHRSVLNKFRTFS